MTRGGTKKQVYKYNDRYFYLYKNKENYDKYIKIINILSKYNFVPKILYKNDDSLVIEVENTGEILNKSHKINNLKIQIKNIISILKQNNIVHNDIITS